MDKLAAWIGNQCVGHLCYDQKTGLFTFAYLDQWKSDPKSYPISPVLPFDRVKEDAIHSRSVRVFFENLLPEGESLDAAAAANGLAKSNLFGLVRALGRETTGAIAMLPEGDTPGSSPQEKREISTEELSRRINERNNTSFSVWDGRVRLSIAGLQDKIAVYIENEKIYLVEGYGLASTHILKPEPRNEKLSSLVANEHFCMSLATKIGLRPASVSILRVPEPVLLIKRFDRHVTDKGVQRIHVIDACQALDLPAGYKYERNFGSGRDVKHIRDGVSFDKLFGLSENAVIPATFQLSILRWVLFQYLIGNSDAHGKNISFYVNHDGLHPAPAYDLVSVVVYNDLDNEMAMGISDIFTFNEVAAYQWVEFANDCGIKRALMQKEMKRIANSVMKAISDPSWAVEYTKTERIVIDKVRSFVASQCEKLIHTASILPDLDAEFDLGN